MSPLFSTSLVKFVPCRRHFLIYEFFEKRITKVIQMSLHYEFGGERLGIQTGC